MSLWVLMEHSIQLENVSFLVHTGSIYSSWIAYIQLTKQVKKESKWKLKFTENWEIKKILYLISRIELKSDLDILLVYAKNKTTSCIVQHCFQYFHVTSGIIDMHLWKALNISFKIELIQHFSNIFQTKETSLS